MALPVVKSLQDCGDYTKTVEPFIPQLYKLPYRVLDSIGSLDSLKQIYIETNPLVTGLDVSIFLGFIFLVVSEINRNYSQVDRLWSILPNLYIAHFALWARLSGIPSSRLELATAFSTLWSVRLTYNYARKGGYNIGSEDYRWEILQRYVPKWVWFIFNVTFISFIQSVLLFSFSGVPAYAILVSTQHQPNVTAGDLLFFGVEVGLVVSEWFSDGQQWDYQTGKQEYKKSGKVTAGYKKEDYERGFITSGLWAYSRHPNFFAEQTIWFVLYQWSCFATENLYSYTGIGSAALILLFQGSTWLTELITSGKYTDYSDYQKQVGMFLPTSLRPYQPSAEAKHQAEKKKA